MGCSNSKTKQFEPSTEQVETFVVDLPWSVVGEILSFQSPKAQGALRSTCSEFQNRFSAAVRAQVHIGCAVCLSPQAQLSDRSLHWSPMNYSLVAKTKILAPRGFFTLIVQPSFFVDPTTRKLPDGFLQHSTASKITVAGSEDVEEFGERCFANCPRLMRIKFYPMPRLSQVRSFFVASCPSLKSADFFGLVAVQKIGASWMARCGSLTAINFSGMLNLREIGSDWLRECESLTAVDFSSLSSLEQVGINWMTGCQLAIQAVQKPPKVELPSGLSERLPEA